MLQWLELSRLSLGVWFEVMMNHQYDGATTLNA